MPPESDTARLVCADRNGDVHAVRLSMAGGADVNCRDHSGGTALIELTDYKGLNALAYATYKSYVGIVKTLLDAGADINFRSRKYGVTALMSASRDNKLELVELLLSHPGIRLEQTNWEGINALSYAAFSGHANIVVGRLGPGPLRHAIANGHTNVVEWLRSHGAALPNPLADPASNAVHAIVMSDPLLKHGMPAAST